jgi:hypothetical protein
MRGKNDKQNHHHCHGRRDQTWSHMMSTTTTPPATASKEKMRDHMNVKPKQTTCRQTDYNTSVAARELRTTSESLIMHWHKLNNSRQEWKQKIMKRATRKNNIIYSCRKKTCWSHRRTEQPHEWPTSLLGEGTNIAPSEWGGVALR